MIGNCGAVHDSTDEMRKEVVKDTLPAEMQAQTVQNARTNAISINVSKTYAPITTTHGNK